MTSVIITVFEQVRTLEVLLRCLERQVCPYEWEVLVTDDGSTPGVFEVVQQAAARRVLDIRYVWQPNRGFRAGVARNNAIKVARGDILIFLDGDVLVGGDFISRHTMLHDGHRLLICGTRRTSFIDSKSNLCDLYRTGQLILAGYEETRLQCARARSEAKWMALLSCNFSVSHRPEVIFDENFLGWGYEDREFAYRLVNTHGYDIRVSTNVEGIHICSSEGADFWNPLRNRHCEQMAFVNLIRNMLYFLDLYPNANLTSALDLLIRRYHIDPLTDEWYMDSERLEPSLDTFIKAARDWMARHGVLLPVISKTDGLAK